MSDIEYVEQGLFTSFVPTSQDGEKLWLELINQNSGSGKVLSVHAKNVISQMRKAGYTVNKAKKVSSKELKRVLDELGDL